MDSPIENCYATLVGLAKIQDFTTNKVMLDNLHTKKDLIERCLEAKKATDAYKDSENKK